MNQTEERGSNWLKCDLHIHSPASHFHQYGDSQDNATWERFISDLENLPEEFKIIGINDYLTLAGYEKVLSYKAQGRLLKIDCILPVIEFRINRFAGESKLKRLNYHVIFSNEIALDIIRSQFISSISSTYTTENGLSDSDWAGIPTNENLIILGQKLKKLSPQNTTLQNETDWKVGFNNFNVNYDQLKEILKKVQFRGRVITAIGKGEWDNFKWDGGAAEKRTVINEADIVFLASNDPVHHQAAKEKLRNDQVNDLLLDCSDAHHYSTETQIKDRIGNCNTWLKIEPTFNGLKQVLFEPEYRIHVGETYPDLKAPYQVISHVNFVNSGKHFTDQKIKMSSSLNSIIGGKSTGKSLLAGLIVKSSDPYEYKRRKGKERLNELNWIAEKQPGIDFHVHWKDGGITKLSNAEESTKKITYFPQHYLNSQINDTGAGNKELNKIIRTILSQTKIYEDAFQSYQEAVQSLDQKIASDASAFETTLKELRSLKHKLKEKGKSEDIQKNVDQLTKELADLKSKYGLTEEELQEHQRIIQTVKSLDEQKSKLSHNIIMLTAMDDKYLNQKIDLAKILGSDYESLSENVKEEVQQKISIFTIKYVEHINSVFLGIAKEQNNLIEEISAQRQKEVDAHTPIIEKIKQSQPLREKNDLIREETNKLDITKALELELEMLSCRLDDIIGRLNNYLQEKVDKTRLVKDIIIQHPFSNKDDQLGIVIEHKCKADHIQNVLKDRIKYQSNPEIKAFINEDDFDDNNVSSYAQRLQTLLKQAKEESIEFKGEHKISGIIQEILSNAIYLNYDLRLGDDSFSIMSPGKRALALLRILIELDQSQHPIILDQPEDDLDNRSVYEGLATYLKKKKIHRQIIVVTHNPNVVVGADSEYVIVANQSGQESNQDNRKFRFEYIFGGLENSFEEEGSPYILERQGIREHVCEILDGGEIAFERREKLYTEIKKTKRKV